MTIVWRKLLKGGCVNTSIKKRQNSPDPEQSPYSLQVLCSIKLNELPGKRIFNTKSSIPPYTKHTCITRSAAQDKRNVTESYVPHMNVITVTNVLDEEFVTGTFAANEIKTTERIVTGSIATNDSVVRKSYDFDENVVRVSSTPQNKVVTKAIAGEEDIIIKSRFITGVRKDEEYNSNNNNNSEQKRSIKRPYKRNKGLKTCWNNAPEWLTNKCIEDSIKSTELFRKYR